MNGIIKVTEEEIDFGAKQLTDLGIGFYYNKKGKRVDFTRQYAKQIIYVAKVKGLDYKKVDYSRIDDIVEKNEKED